jgi:predicted choloylglycine hydrolase
VADIKLLFRWTSEDVPGPRWLELFARAWPAYRSWFLFEGAAARPPLAECKKKLLAHMPELVPQWERLIELSGGNQEVARMLALYRPTPYMAGCTQAVRPKPHPFLVRNYDYHPHACEATFVRTRWMGTTVVAASECLWGVLDGINEHGLSVALSFGGSTVVGDGFGVPLILRYVLESCASVADARKVLRRVPSHMAYNVSLVDSSGAFAVAYLRPGTDTVLVREAVATNHQKAVEWPEHAARTRSVERKREVRRALRGAEDSEELVDFFLTPPLFVTDYEHWHGTLYTALYVPEEGSLQVYWPGASVRQTIDEFVERELQVPFRVQTDVGGG